MSQCANSGAGTPSTADRVTDELRAAIVEGRLAPGQVFSLRRVAGELGASFTPVREALRSLEAEGLVTADRGCSAVVTAMTADDAVGIVRLRRLVEPDLVALAAELHTTTSLVAVTHTLLACGDPGISVERHRSVHHRVHLDLLRPAMSRWDSRLVEMLLHATSRYLRLEPNYATSWSQLAGIRRDEHVGAHHELLDALRTGDAGRARVLLRQHLDQVEREVHQRWEGAASIEASVGAKCAEAPARPEAPGENLSPSGDVVSNTCDEVTWPVSANVNE